MANPIQWAMLNETKTLLETSYLMVGEEKQLTVEEVEEFNQILLSLVVRAGELQEIAGKVQGRFRNR